jgi:NADPH2:quinone reductase
VKAVVVRERGPFEGAAYTEVPDPKAAAGEVVVGVAAAEANYPDILVMEGSYQFRPPLPFSPGKAAAGVIESVADDVENLRPGDRVAVQVEYGAYAEKLTAPAVNCYPVPDGVSLRAAAALGLVYQTAHFALVERARLRPGETVLVLGASGGIGVASVQLAKALGAGVVIGGILGEDNAAVARGAGADFTVDLGASDLREALRESVREMTGGHGVDAVIDPVGGMASAAALRAMAWCGRLVIIGFASGDIPAFKANYLLVKNISVLGLQWSDYRERDPAWVASVQADLFELHRAGKLEPHVSRTFALADFAEALRLLRDGEAQGKILLEVVAA